MQDEEEEEEEWFSESPYKDEKGGNEASGEGSSDHWQKRKGKTLGIEGWQKREAEMKLIGDMAADGLGVANLQVQMLWRFCHCLHLRRHHRQQGQYLGQLMKGR